MASSSAGAIKITEQRIDLGRVIGNATGVLARNAFGLFLVGLVLAGVPNFALRYFQLSLLFSDSATIPGGFWGYWALSFIVSTVSSALLQIVVMRSAILHLNGRPADIGGSVAASIRLILPVVGLSLVTSFIVLVGLVMLIVPGVIANVLLILSVPVLIQERLSIDESMRRSVDLSRGSRPVIFALVVALYILSWVAWMLAISIMDGMGVEDIPVAALLQALEPTISATISAVLIAALYVEIRTTKEGATVEGLTDIFA